MPTRRVFCLGLGASLCGCAGAVQPQPAPPREAITRATAEVEAERTTPRRALAPGEFTGTIRRVATRLTPPGQELCRELGVARCDWFVQYSRSHDLNASARADGSVVINRGIVEYARTEDEVAFVMGHEIGHQSANHVMQGIDNATVGATIGTVLMSALVVASAASGGRTSVTENRRAINNGARLGGQVGRLSFSKDQEREADRLGAILVYRAGYDLDAARTILVTMARVTERRETGLFDSHPAGPERLAAFDALAAELRATQGRVPIRPA